MLELSHCESEPIGSTVIPKEDISLCYSGLQCLNVISSVSFCLGWTAKGQYASVQWALPARHLSSVSSSPFLFISASYLFPSQSGALFDVILSFLLSIRWGTPQRALRTLRIRHVHKYIMSYSHVLLVHHCPSFGAYHILSMYTVSDHSSSFYWPGSHVFTELKQPVRYESFVWYLPITS